MAGSFLAELLKLRKRPAVWILGSIWLAFVVVFLYLLPVLILDAVAANDPPETSEARFLEEQFSNLLPENLATYLLDFLLPGVGPVVGLILGALAAGSEYGWGTLRIVLSQGSGRLGVLSGKLLALCALLLLFVLAAFLGAASSSLVVALLSGASPAPPPTAELLAGLGAGALTLVLWAALGFALATLFKSTALAVGLGLIYTLILEWWFSALFDLGEFFQMVAEFLPGVNTAALCAALAEATRNPGVEEVLLVPVRSALIMLLYTVAFVLITALVFRRRDVV